jgi:phage minor structural protein
MRVTKVYNKNKSLLAMLENAYDIGYSLEKNGLYTATFSLPADDPKNEYCQSLNLVEIWDGDKRIELFRIIGEDFTRSTDAVKVYNCEHVLATLLNDVLFLYHQIGNVGVYTETVLNYILSKQTVPRWQLGVCDFNRQFEYKWENESLLAALFSVPECFDEDYLWTYDTTATPWTINLIRPSTEIKSEIRYGKNMQGIIKTIDSTNLATRLYCLGYGEGDNQLTIKSVNNGKAYLDADTQSTWGVLSSVLVDRRFENPETLKSYGQTMLNQLKNPYISYEAWAIDLYQITKDSWDEFRLGDIIRVIDLVDDIVITAPIVKIEKPDVTGNPSDIRITIANKDKNIVGSISELQSRTLINQTYAQGATNISMQNFADNADTENPATFKVYIPEETARINKLILSVEFEPFRSYSKGVEAGGGATITSSAGGGTVTTTDGGGGESVTSGSGIDVIYAKGVTDPSQGHSHSFDVVQSHKHRSTLDDHTHDIELDDHDHEVEIDDHVHPMKYGIYTGTTASSAQIIVDGNIMPTISDYDNIDLVNYLSKDTAGKIQRNTWHVIEIKPNRLTRISASLFMQLFCQSRGGGDY